MTPNFSRSYRPDMPVGNAVFLGKVLTSLRSISNLMNLFFCELGNCITFPTILNRTASPLFKHIGNIFFLGSKEQMSWVYTRSHITLMEYLKALWDDSSVNIPRNSMSVLHFSADAKSSIVAPAFRSNPKPTGLGFHNMLQKSCFHFSPVTLIQGVYK